ELIGLVNARLRAIGAETDREVPRQGNDGQAGLVRELRSNVESRRGRQHRCLRVVRYKVEAVVPEPRLVQRGAPESMVPSQSAMEKMFLVRAAKSGQAGSGEW